MTPLAHRIANEMTLPVKKRTFVDEAGLLGRFDDIHCFEVSAVTDLAFDLAREFAAGNDSGLAVFGGLAFLPAPRTWIECDTGVGRLGMHLSDRGDGWGIVRVAVQEPGEWRSAELGEIPLDENPDLGVAMKIVDGWTGKQADRIVWHLYAFLSMINSPRRIGQRVHMPHAGLQRALARAHRGVGKYPLNAWTEITHKVAPPVDASNEAEWRDYLSNRMPLHFVRAHKRRIPDRFGSWVLIPAHWRGDAALGIKLTRYRLVA